ncbi:MAG: DNA-methyltransferase [Clostridium sp.]|uniref:DNA-methyltransferase n=1 Tax=Clostridium sp. TaxID=1506 RepID=UPI003EE546BC
MKRESLSESIMNMFLGTDFTLEEVYDAIPEKPHTTIRGRIYDNIGKRFTKVKRGVYRVIEGENECIVIEGNGRDLSFLPNSSIDCIMTDHPWSDKKSNIGGDRKFTNTYECFNYTNEDFKEKFRVLKDGCFLVELIPAENENNYKYLYELKLIAEKEGFKYYAKVSWKKGTFVSNTGRKAKNSEELMIFSKGKARNLRLDAKKTKNTGEECFMSGTSKMLPTQFDIQSVPVRQKLHQSEKPVELWEEVIPYVTKENEIILDQFAGVGAVGIAALNTGRNSVMIEIDKDNVGKILDRINKQNSNN